MNVHTNAEAATGAGTQWFVYAQGEVIGPFLLEQMVALAGEGRMTRRSQTTRRGSPDWKSAADDEALQTIFSDAPVGQASLHSSLAAAPMSSRLAVKPKPNAGPADVAPAPAAQVTPPPVDPHEAPAGTPASTDMPWAASYSTAGPSQARAASARWAGTAGADASIKGKQRLAASDDPHPLLAGLVSLILPGVGQFWNGNIMRGILFGTAALLLWTTDLGWFVHLWAALDAALLAGRAADRQREIRTEAIRAARRIQ